MLVTDPDPARWISTLGASAAVQPAMPTLRWASTWTVATASLAYERCVYGIYVREVQFKKWVATDVADLIRGFPGDIGSGTMPAGWDGFCVPGTAVTGKGRWLLLYVGLSVSTTNPRILQYFGRSNTFTREPGGQSLHLDLAHLIGGPVDVRNRTEPRSRSIAGALRGALSLNLEARMREMELSYAQVVCPACVCGEKGRDPACHAQPEISQPSACIHDNESRLIRHPPGVRLGGAIPLMNGQW